MNKDQLKSSLLLCLAGSVGSSWSLAQGVVGSNNTIVSESAEFSENIQGKVN